MVSGRGAGSAGLSCQVGHAWGQACVIALRGRGPSGRGDGHDQADLGQDVPDPHALGFGPDLDDRLARVVDLPGDLPAFGLRAGDRLDELADDLLEGVAVAVVEDRHPRGADGRLGPLELLEIRCGGGKLRHGYPLMERSTSLAMRNFMISSEPAPMRMRRVLRKIAWTGKSVVYPMPPSTCMASSTTFQTVSATKSLVTADSSWAGTPASVIFAVR